MAGHQAASNAPLTSRLAITTTLPLSNSCSMNCFIVLAASVVLFLGVNSNWFSFIYSILFMWCITMFINRFSSTLPAIFNKLIGRYLNGSKLSSLPGLVTVIILATFQFLGKHPLFKHSL